MRKLLINKVLIEKTQKDINTNIPYDFDNGFNLICGENEAGKSSLMEFIENSFLLQKKDEAGKIFFCLNKDEQNSVYRADINLSKSTIALRCKVIDSNNTPTEPSILIDEADKKYFKQGFCITLDDLNDLKCENGITLDNIIKDPSANKLNDFLADMKKNISNVVGERNDVVGNTKKVYENIKSLERQISELSNNENEYNSVLKQIELTNKNIDENQTIESILADAKELEQAKKSLNELQLKANNKLSSLNQDFINNEDKYFDLITNVGLYNRNTVLINDEREKLNNICVQLNEELSSLSSVFGVNLSTDEIINFEIDDKTIKSVKDIMNSIKEEENKISLLVSSREEKINFSQKINCEINELKLFDKKISNFEELKKINFAIKNNLEDYTLINEKLTSENGNKTNKPAILPVIITVFLCIAFSAVLYFQKNYTPIFFIIGIAIISSIAEIIYNYFSQKNNNEFYLLKKEKQNIINELKTLLKEIYPEIETLRDNLLSSKIETIAQKIENTITIFEEKSGKLSTLKNEIQESNNNIEGFKNNVAQLNNNLIELKNNFKDLKNEEFLDFIEKIKFIKEIGNKKRESENSISKLEEQNSAIVTELKKFILSNNININISENLTQTIENLKKYQETNNLLKDEIKELNKTIDNENNRIKNIEEEVKKLKNSLSKEIEITNIDFQLQEIKEEQTNLNEEKESLKKRKYELEKVQGIIDLKEEKNILLKEYKNTIKNLLINKMIINLTDKAKSTFDKTMPDLVNAQKYLSILTDNKYCEINLDLKEISGENNVNTKKWDNLSRGTKEQLYLALRLGYASNYTIDKTTGKENNKYSLPLIVDDAFVNFDHSRTKNAIKSLLEFAKTNQVLFFTCHEEEIKNILKEITNEKDINFIQI